jgi:threonine/homoserine/homoserine lactone efflux protein
MSPTIALLTFTLAAAVLTITPGMDTAPVLRTAAVEGPRRAVSAVFGIYCGLLLWGLAVALVARNDIEVAAALGATCVVAGSKTCGKHFSRSPRNRGLLR